MAEIKIPHAVLSSVSHSGIYKHPIRNIILNVIVDLVASTDISLNKTLWAIANVPAPKVTNSLTTFLWGQRG